MASIYNTGTISVVADGTVVTGVGTLWRNLKPGDVLFAGLGSAPILTVVDDTHVTIPPWKGGTLVNAIYTVTMSSIDRTQAGLLADAVAKLVKIVDPVVPYYQVVSIGLNAPPGTPADGDMYVVGAAPTGLWSGRAGNVATWVSTGWDFQIPQGGWHAYNVANNQIYAFNAGVGGWGAVGNNGTNGNTVLSGTTVPAAGTGANGDFYIRTTTSMIYGPKAAGAWPAGVSLIGAPGTNGTNGTNGATGADGRTVLSGTIAPAAGVGANGDFYINTATWLIYGPKAAGAWPSGVSMLGAVADDSITNAKLANMVTATFKARATAGTGDPEDITPAAAMALLMASGQIPFPATQNPSSNANTLDDYEEGVTTPTITSSIGTITTVGTCTLAYVKVGRLVAIVFSLAITTAGTGAGQMQMSLPFTSGSAGFAVGVEIQATGVMFGSFITNGGVNAGFTRYDGVTVIANGRTFIGGGLYYV